MVFFFDFKKKKKRKEINLRVKYLHFFCFKFIIKGVFCNYGNKKSPFKLRLLYECAPIALLFECAGAMAVTASGDRLLDLPMGLDTRWFFSFSSFYF